MKESYRRMRLWLGAKTPISKEEEGYIFTLHEGRNCSGGFKEDTATNLKIASDSRNDEEQRVGLKWKKEQKFREKREA